MTLTDTKIGKSATGGAILGEKNRAKGAESQRFRPQKPCKLERTLKEAVERIETLHRISKLERTLKDGSTSESEEKIQRKSTPHPTLPLFGGEKVKGKR